jgi:hypothetical protein
MQAPNFKGFLLNLWFLFVETIKRIHFMVPKVFFLLWTFFNKRVKAHWRGGELGALWALS